MFTDEMSEYNHALNDVITYLQAQEEKPAVPNVPYIRFSELDFILRQAQSEYEKKWAAGVKEMAYKASEYGYPTKPPANADMWEELAGMIKRRENIC